MADNKGYVCLDSLGYIVGALTIITIIVFGCMLAFGLRLDYAEGSHKIEPTAVDKDIWGNYRVYYKTSDYTQDSQENYYYIDKDNSELAEEMKEYIKQGKKVIVYYGEYVGWKGLTAPGTSPIIQIEILESEGN